MKLKTLTISLLFIFQIHSVSSQNWFQPGDKWIHNFSFWFNVGYDEFEVSSDTMIDNQACKQLVGQLTYIDVRVGSSDTILGRPYSNFFYEENNRVFQYYDDDFQLIYDFNRQIGDTLRLRKESCEEEYIMILDSISSMSFGNGIDRIVQYVRVPEGKSEWETYWNTHLLKIVEGIGILEVIYAYDQANPRRSKGSLSPYNQFGCISDDVGLRIRCFESEQFSYNPDSLDCYELPIINSLSERNNSPLSLHPNPVQNSLHIQLPSTAPIDQIRLFSSEGKLLFQKQAPNGYLDVQHLNQGMYILQVDSGKNSFTEKIIKL